jgi:hypothetical protein
MTGQQPAHAGPPEHVPSVGTTTQSAPSATPLYRRLARKEARVREDQYVALSRLVRVLAGRRTDRSGPRLTENTLIRVAIDLLLSRANRLAGNTEDEIRASALRGEQPGSSPDSR